MTTIAHSADPVAVIRNQIDAVLDMMEASTTLRAEAKLSRTLPPLWSALEEAKPTTLAGAAILIREASDYEGELQDAEIPFGIVPMLGQLARMADRVKAWAHTSGDVRALELFANSAIAAFGVEHPMTRLLSSAAAYLARLQ